MRRDRCWFTAVLMSLLCVLAAPVSLGAQEADAAFMGNSWRYENGSPRTELSGDRLLLFNEAPGQKPLDGGRVPDETVLPEGALGRGIDVSSFQGKVDWAKVKAAGVDFAILRAGYGRAQMDARFIENVTGCKEHGIPFGVYLYAYSWDADSARREAEGTLELLERAGVKPSDLTLPVYYDIENTVGKKDHPDFGKPAGVDEKNEYRVIPDNETFASMAKSYCTVISSAGYMPGVYTSTSWWRDYLNDPIFDTWTRWVAQYYSECTYEGDYDIWQYTSTGSVDGIEGNVDMNYIYSPFTNVFADVSFGTAHSADIKWLCDEGISTGFGDGTFRPYSVVARADMAAFLHRMVGEPSVALPSDRVFVDTPTGMDHYRAIAWLKTSGLSTGWDNHDGTFSFRPYAGMARADMAAFLYRLAGSPQFDADEQTVFADVDQTTPHHREILWLAESGISKGWICEDGEREFRPYAQVARADMAAFLHRMVASGLVPKA